MEELAILVMNSMFLDILFFLSVYGIATIISSEYIFMSLIDKFKRFDKLHYLLTCNKCMSVWIGGLVSFFYWSVLTPVLDAALCYVVASILNKLLDDDVPE